jgi:hypothetical protein
MKMPNHVVEMLEQFHVPLHFELTDSWKSLPDDNGEIHCSCCAKLIFEGDGCLVSYFTYTSIVFCLDCYRDNQQVLSRWLKGKTKGSGVNGIEKK